MTECSTQGGKRQQQVEIVFSSLKRVFGLDQTLAKTLVRLVTRIVEDFHLHLCLIRKPAAGKASGPNEGTVGISIEQSRIHASSERRALTTISSETYFLSPLALTIRSLCVVHDLQYL